MSFENVRAHSRTRAPQVAVQYKVASSPSSQLAITGRVYIQQLVSFGAQLAASEFALAEP